MVKVRATSASKNHNINIKELHRIVEEGEVFEVTDDRVEVLLGKNKYGLAFITLVEEVIKEEVVLAKEPEEPTVIVIEPGEEPKVVSKPKKSSTKKTTSKKSTKK